VDDVFLRDRRNGTIRRVSVSSSGAEANLGDGTSAGYGSASAAVSSDGRYVAFGSGGSNLVPGDTNGQSDVFVHDTRTGVTRRVNVSSAGGQSSQGAFASAISGNGRVVLFESSAPDLAPGDANGNIDLFAHDLVTGSTIRVNVSSSGAESSGSGGQRSGTLSSDGRLAAFVDGGTGLVRRDTNRRSDVFVRGPLR
jgi:Tol biopolymer transport system component